MFTLRRIPVLVLSTMFLFSCISVQAGRSQRNAVLVVPNRFAIVQLGFSVAQMRKMRLVTYEKRVKNDDLLMYAWNAGKHEWVKTNLEAYRSGALVTGRIRNIIIIGEEGTVPAELSKAPVWCSSVKIIETFDILTIINSLNDVLTFKMREWRWFAKEYGLTLNDQNKDRRRYGRYGKPGEKREMPVPPDEVGFVPVLVDEEPTIDIVEKGVPVAEPVVKFDEQPVMDVDLQEKNLDLPVEEKLPEDK